MLSPIWWWDYLLMESQNEYPELKDKKIKQIAINPDWSIEVEYKNEEWEYITLIKKHNKWKKMK